MSRKNHRMKKGQGTVTCPDRRYSYERNRSIEGLFWL